MSDQTLLLLERDQQDLGVDVARLGDLVDDRRRRLIRGAYICAWAVRVCRTSCSGLFVVFQADDRVMWTRGPPGLAYGDL